MTYAVRLKEFEGPLELLLQLIEREKLDITRVSLASVADQFLEYLAQQREVTLSQLSQFLVIASRLILLKSRALLPLLEFTEEEEQSIEDLEWQLREYRKFRDASIEIGILASRQTRAFPRLGFIGLSAVFTPPRNVTAHTLSTTFEEILGTIPLSEPLEQEMVPAIVSLEEKMLELRASLTQRIEYSFREMTADVSEKMEMIIAFLAVLELVKQRFLLVDQKETFSDIALQRHST